MSMSIVALGPIESDQDHGPGFTTILYPVLQRFCTRFHNDSVPGFTTILYPVFQYWVGPLTRGSYLIPEHPSQDLARGALRDRVDENNVVNHLVGGDMAFHESRDVFGA